MSQPDLANDYARSARPRLMRRLRACRLDRVYHRAEGDWLWTRTADGREVKVLDAVGGFGVGLLGHHHPAVVGALRQALDQRLAFHAQGSVRGPAGQLCRRLSEVVGAYTGRRYVVTLASSGAEAVEAAIKHAELERRAKVDALIQGCRQRHSSIQEKLRNRECDVVPRLLDQAAQRLGMGKGAQPDVEEIFHHVLAHNLRLAEAPPLFLALEGAFHGKTTGAVQLTHEPEYRAPFRALGIDVRFLPRDDVSALEQAVEQATVTFLDLAVGQDGAVTIEERPFVNVAALFVEPIQGEGGVRPLGADFLRALSGVARRRGFPLVLDEIQSGCGRAGTFLASEQDGVIGDYYLLSKALGGGLAKVSALLVDSARYQDRFGYVHSSTFAEDDLSSAVALAALEVLASPAFLDGVRRRGERLRAGLLDLQRRYPGVLRDVRGRGLMLGIELVPFEASESPTFRVLSEQEHMGFIVAGYLLNVCRVRVLPTLSQPDTLRLQLSGLASDEDLAHLLKGVERVCKVLRLDRSDELIGFLCDDAEWPEKPAAHRSMKSQLSSTGAVTRPARKDRVPPYAGRVAFMGHFIRPGHLGLWDPALADFDEAALDAYLTRVHRMLDPFLSETVNIGSVTGERVQLSAIAVPLTPRLIERGFEEGNVRWVEEMVVDGIKLARRHGASVVGLGGHLSILTGQGKRLSEDRIALTSGNSMTVAMGLEALFQTAKEEQVDLGKACLGAVGATGNICSLFAQIAADVVPRIVLVGRRGMESRLRHVAEEVYFEAFKTIKRAGGGRPLKGLTKLISETETLRRVLADPSGVGRIGPAIWAGLAQEMQDAAPIVIKDDPLALRECDLIVSASSAREAVLFPEHLGPGKRVVCDLAVPEDTSPRVLEERPDVKVIRGGIVRLPVDHDLTLPGLPLEPGCVFACLAETLLLGLSRVSEHFSYGRLTRSHVEAVRDLARYHGFTLQRPSMTSVL